MIWLLKAGVRTGLVAAAMVTAVSMTALAQKTEPAIGHVTATDQPAVADVSPTGDENGTEDNTSVQTDPSTTPETPTVIDIEIQSRFNELRRELLADRVSVFDWQLTITAIALTLVFGIVSFLGFRRFREIETAARKGAESAARHAEDAERLVRKIEKNWDFSQEMIRDIRSISAEIADNNPDKASQAARVVAENPQASLIDTAIARAVSLQQEGRRSDAIEKWRGIAHVAEGTDNDLAAAAWFSVGYLLQNGGSENSISAYDDAIRLKPDYALAYNNRGNAKAALGRHVEAIADFDEAIRLKLGFALAYYNRGNPKAALGRHVEAIADFDEAIRLKPGFADAYYNRGNAKKTLGRQVEAIVDYDETIRLKPDDAAYNNRGTTKAVLGRHVEAIADFDEAIRLKPDNALAYNNRGKAKAVLGRHVEAIADYDEAIRLKPDLADAYNNRGTTKAALGHKDEARKDFETALELARNANNVKIVALAEKSLRSLDSPEGL